MNSNALRTVESNPGKDLGNQVAEQLARQLFSGAYRPGDMLPRETDLAEKLSVSRASLRTGLQILAGLGIIRRQVGQGTMVEEFREWRLLDPLVTRWMVDYANPSPAFMAEVFAFRHSIEPYISAIAAKHATARDLAEIEAAYLMMEKGLKDGSDAAFSEADIEFHTAIYRATHNLVWAQLAHILRPAILLVIRESNATAEELSDSLGRHRKVLEHIRLRQPAAAFDAAIRVMERTAQDLGLASPTDDHDLLALLKARQVPGPA